MIENGYATLPEFKDYAIANGVADDVDDGVIEKLVQAASRYIDDHTGRRFWPRVETRYYSVTDSPQLWLDDDLLELTTLTNGDTTVITSTYYNLLPKNEYPKYAVRLKASSNYYWEVDSNSDSEYVISVLGLWGYHEWYNLQGWKSITTVVEAANLNATDVTFTLASAADLLVEGGQIIRIENELMQVLSKSGADVTVRERGGNGSTAATHANGTAVKLWQYQPDITEACLEIASSVYKRRTGENATSTSILTSGGVIVTPRDVPDMAAAIIHRYARLV